MGLLLDLDPASPRHRSLAIFASDTSDAASLRYRGMAVEALPATCGYRFAVTLHFAGDAVSWHGWADGDIPAAAVVPAP